MSFKGIIGNKNNKELLTKIVEKNQSSHSYMFIGIEGIGKFLFAKEFAHMLLCMGDNINKPCDKCKSCVEFLSQNHPDYYELNLNENTIKIEQIRMLQSKILEKPIVSKRKVYIINDADKMTKEAQNCLLKTLEEPPEYVCIILIVSNESMILNTIKSRCTKMQFKPIDESELKEFLNQHYQINSISSAYLKSSQGSIAKALKMNENAELYEEIDKVFYNMEKINLIDILGKFDALYKNKEQIYDLLDYINTILFEKSKQDMIYISYIQKIEQVKKNLKANANYDMSIDSLLFDMFK